MSPDSEAAFAPVDRGARPALSLLVAEASRQLTVCNSCRYCEGLCAVFPALERRTLFTAGDVTQLANLCHDCRACFDDCMYTPPHEFAINLPTALSAVRTTDYRRLVWPARVPRFLAGWSGFVSGIIASTLLVLLVAGADTGFSNLVHRHPGAASPYSVISYPVLLAVLLVPALFAIGVMLDGGRRYWREVTADSVGRPSLRAVLRAVHYAATLRYLRGGGQECYYPKDEKPSAIRRRLHALVAYGFGLCLVSTTSAGVLQDILGSDPPYPVVSVPVLTGIAGGAALALGAFGLLWLKANSSPVTSVREMTIKDYGFLVALAFLAVTGIATLVTRDTAAFGLVFLVHMAAIVLTFAAAPYSKFVHLQYRFLALVKDGMERENAAAH